MRIENIVALTQARLLNLPCVSSFENVAFDIRMLKRGDIFVAYDIKDIPLAIQNGAYGIIKEQECEISDNEIAWLHVDSIDEALKKLMRFRAIEKELNLYKTNEIILKLAQNIQTSSNFIPLNMDLKKAFLQIWKANQRDIVLFCDDFLKAEMFADVKSLPKQKVHEIDIIEKTLFETSFIYDNVFYERQLISPFFIPYLQELLNFFTILKIEFKIKKFNNIEHFQAVFTNKKFEIKDFGTSDKVLIFEKNTSLVNQEILFLQKNASWASLIFILPYSLKENSNSLHAEFYYYKNKNEILNILKNNSFHFAFIVGADKTILSKPSISQQSLLFT